MNEIFTQTGLSPDEAVVYDDLLHFGPSMVGEILKRISKRIKTKRTNLYNLLRSLKDKGLILEKTKEGKTYFEPESPTKLFNVLDDKFQTIDRIKKNLATTMPELNSLYNLTTNKPVIQFFEGLGGFKKAAWDSLSSPETLLTYIDIEAIEKYQHDIDEEYVKLRLDKKIAKKILANNTPLARNFFNLNKDALTEVRFLPEKLKIFEVAMQIYEGKIAYYTSRKNNIISVIIQDQGLYEMNKNIFAYLWKISEKQK